MDACPLFFNSATFRKCNPRMATLLIALGALVAYLVAYHTYGRWLARKIFALDPGARLISVTNKSIPACQSSSLAEVEADA